MKPFLGFSEKERLFFSMLHDRSELEAAIKEGSLLLLGELEYLLLIDNPEVEIEWSMEMGKDYFSFPVPLRAGGEATCYVGFDYDRGFFPSVANDRADKLGRLAFIDTLARKRDDLSGLGVAVDADGTLSIEDPGMPAESVSEADIGQWRADAAEIYVGKIFNPGDDGFASRNVLTEIHETVRALLKIFRADR